jgi:hypothetical protein
MVCLFGVTPWCQGVGILSTDLLAVTGSPRAVVYYGEFRDVGSIKKSEVNIPSVPIRHFKSAPDRLLTVEAVP